ncbi:MAG TPA: molybdopterin-binding protein [Lachnospiraceae bacterium]|nr:molybdopterin-binding protein [Lachnospiraceae bacterium]HAP73468.1 molybdopterin-binding protein [Lachnospiraceae bacterium]HBH70764.1 molybdopterin-binding protein [Lachnospiraceae bacterium]
MKLMRTEDAVGQILCHDITRIVKDGEKGPVFRKGHVIREEDIEVLLAVGKDHIYIWENNENMMHENDAAMVLCGLCRNEFMHPTEIKEGKTELIADIDGLLKVDSGKLQRINSQGQMMIATRHGNTVVRAGDRLAGMRVIPLVIEKEKMEAAKRAVPDGKILTLLPFVHKKVGIITTGNEILSHRIEDTFTPVVLHKLAAFDCEIVGQYMTGDDPAEEILGIRRLLEAGADMILCTSGMSVDPDDRTPQAIREAAGSENVITYGAPVLPGAMFMLAYYQGNRHIPIVGLPGCVMYARRTIFDIVLPRFMADDPVSREEFWKMGEGGLCLGEGGACAGCDVCTFPNCGFGK